MQGYRQCYKQLYRFCQNQKDPFHKETSQSYLHEERMTENFKKISQQYDMQINEKKIFSNYKIYENLFEMKGKYYFKLLIEALSQRINLAGIYSLIWFGISGFTYYFIHPYATFIPLGFAITQVASFRQGKKYLNYLVKYIQLDPSLKTCDIQVASGQRFKAEIHKNELIDLIDVINNVKHAEDVIEKYKKSNFVLLFSATNMETQKDIPFLRLLISPDQIYLENLDLVRTVIEGEDLSEWVYQETSSNYQSQQNDDPEIKALEDELEEEMNKKKQDQSEEQQKTRHNKDN